MCACNVWSSKKDKSLWVWSDIWSDFFISPFPFSSPAEIDQSYSLHFPEDARLVFKGKTHSYPSAGHTEQAKEYSLDIELFDAVLGDKARKTLTGKSLIVTVPKKGTEQIFGQKGLYF